MAAAPGGASATRALVASEGIGGIFVPSGSDALLRSGALGSLRTPDGIPVMVAIDEEGGRVSRIKAIAGPIPSARVMARTLTVDQVRALARRRGDDLRRLGVTVDLAPVIDVSDQPDNSVIGDRSFSNDPAVVVRYAFAFADGLREAGILPVFKHFPGHGHADGDSHKQATTTPALKDLGPDLLPYRKLLSNSAGVLVGHLDVPGLTRPGEPATVSPAAVQDLLRGQLRFNGVAFTDDITGMRAITTRFSTPEAARRAIAAGMDIALLGDPTAARPVLDALEKAVRSGSLNEAQVNASVLRVLIAKHSVPCR